VHDSVQKDWGRLLEPKRACPHCDALELTASSEPGVMICSACGASSLLPSGAGSEPRRRIARSRAARRAPGEVPSWPAALGAIVLTALFYGLLHLMPAGRLAELFLERGWVPYVISGVSSWALLLLAARFRKLRSEAKALDLDLIDAADDRSIAPEDVARTIASLEDRSGAFSSSFVVARLERALRHFEARRRVVEVVEFLSQESRADEGRVDASYALIRVFVWAVPTLGFIGTVIGIGAAVGAFSETLEAAASIESMKDSIGSVTGGLGVAFDTTLLALVMSILIMFPASAVQRIEENLLGEVDDYCAEWLVRRLRDAGEGVDDALISALAVRLLAEMRSSQGDA